MNVVYHPAVQQDVSRILRRYDAINDRLGDEFWKERNAMIQRAAANPQRFHFSAQNRRRANLCRFPVHFLFREIADGLRITAVRHHRQNPATGLQRRQPA